MVQELTTQPNMFGRLGKGLAQGLSETIPKEIERQRLSSGLKDLEGQSGLTPFQQFSRLAAIPGITPQMLQSGSELLKQQGMREAYKRASGTNGTPASANAPTGNELAQQYGFGNQPTSGADNIQRQVVQGQPTIPSDVSRQQEATSNEPAARENPLSEKFLPVAPWSQARQEQAINEAFDRGLATSFPEAQAYANSQKELYENAPEKYRQQLDYKKGVDQEVDDLFDKHLQTRLQKKGEETFKDIPGDLQLNIKKVARNAVATGKMTPEQAAEYYSKKASDLAKDKGRVVEIANRDVFDRILPKKKEETIKNLMHLGKTFEDLGCSEDFYNLLTTDTIDESGRQQGMGLSPGGAAIIQYPRTEKVKQTIKNTKISSKNPSQSTRAFAENLFKVMTPKDSFLSIARQMKEQDPNFDEYAFFDYLRENKDQYGSNPRLNREVNRGVSDFFPNWRDIGLFPAFTKSVAND